MNIFLVALALAAGPYNVEDMYYYEASGLMKALPIQNKAFVQGQSEETEKWLAEHELMGDLSSFERKNIRLVEGYMVHFRDLRQIAIGMKAMQEAKIAVTPVVSYQTMECVPTDAIVFKTRFSVTEEDLRQHLGEAYNLSFTNLGSYADKTFRITGIVESTPSNILRLANLMSEDSSWFEFARVDFLPVESPIEARLSIENPAKDDLGYMRNLVLTIKVAHKRAFVRKDLLPKLGQGDWLPNFVNGGRWMPKQEVWYDFEQPIIKEQDDGNVRTVSVTYPFRFFHNDRCKIPNVPVVYEVDGELAQVTAEGIEYSVASLIQDTEISDIQPLRTETVFPTSVEMPKKINTTPYPFERGGWIAVQIGCVFLAIQALWKLIAWLACVSESKKAKRAKLQILDNLKDTAHILQDECSWKFLYLELNRNLAIVFSEILHLSGPQSSSSIASSYRFTGRELLISVMSEVEKAYQEKAQPNIKELQTNVLALAEKLKVYV